MLHDPHAKDREKPESCVTCRFYFPTKKGNHGDCRRNPPVGNYNGHPTVYPNGWCGEYKWDEIRSIAAGRAAMAEEPLKKQED